MTTYPRIKLVCAAIAVLSSALPSMAQLSGAIFTTDQSGTIVNGNLFTAKTDVYLDGGPQNLSSGSGLPDGTYYFQVTDPSGKILLSADDVTCRQVLVVNGKFAGTPDISTTPSACTGTTPAGAYHPVGTTNVANGTLPVQLCPATSAPRSNDGNPGFDPSNWCDSTGNPGGVYKVWVTPVSAYVGPGGTCPTGNNVSGFCDSDVKTKTFKVRTTTTASVAFLTVCKFNDLNGNGVQDTGEPVISGWPITANGVDTESGPIGTVNEQTDETGCVSFSVSNFSSAGPATGGVVTVSEGLPTGWEQTAPEVGTYSVPDGTGGSGTVSVTVSQSNTTPVTNLQTLTLVAGDDVTVNSFGNTCVNFDPTTGCGGNTVQLTVTKDANPSLTRTYKWTIAKSVDTPTVYSAGGGTSNAANYTVNVTHDAGTDSNWQVTGTITISNPSLAALTGVNVSDAVDDGGTCTISFPGGGSGPITIPGGTFDSSTNTVTASTTKLNYTCTYPSPPADGTNTAMATWGDSGSAQGKAAISFAPGSTAITYIDNTVNVTDSLDGGTPTTLGSVTVKSDGSTMVTGGTVDAGNSLEADFTYSHTFTDPVGVCTNHPNTATFTSTTIPTTGSPTSNNASASVQDCQGADLTVSKTAVPSFTRTYNWMISKTANPSVIDTSSGSSASFNYSVTASESGFSDSNWQVTGVITVDNPNTWETVSVNLSDSLTGVLNASCTITGGNIQTVPEASSTTSPGVLSAGYTCTYSSAPSPLSGTNAVSATWNATTSHTPDGMASYNAAFDFTTVTPTKVNASITPTDTFNGGSATNLCTLASSTPCTLTASDTSPLTSQVYMYSRSLNAPSATCTTYPNTAATGLTGMGQTSGASVKLCGASPLTISKTAQGSFSQGITKTGPASPVENSGTFSLKYTVTVTEGSWSVAGTITLANPNDWEAIAVSLKDALSDTKGTCSITGGAPASVAASTTLNLPYTCSFPGAPSSAAGTNTATVTWNPTTSYTGGTGIASGGAGYVFSPSMVTVTDTFTNTTTGTTSTTTLGTITTPTAITTYTPTYSVTPPPGSCWDFTNTARIVGPTAIPPGPSATYPTTGTLTVCNTNTGALTMGFWKNNNGQGIITKSCGGTSGTSLMAFLAGVSPNGFNPFRDDTATSCSKEATYVSNIISGATCTSATNTCNSMLRAQMLATALDVYFSTPNLGGNQIGSYTGLGNNQPALGNIVINLSAIHPCSDGSGGATCTGNEDTRPEFGIAQTASCLGTTVNQMLEYANFDSTKNGSPVATANTGADWYNQSKASQVPAKDSFDDFNNQIAPITTLGCLATY